MPIVWSKHCNSGEQSYSTRFDQPLMEFTIQYFGIYDRLLYLESLDVNELIEALDRARMIIRQSQPDSDPQPVGYVILDNRGRQVARGYRRDG
jgi:hypothetical protein